MNFLQKPPTSLLRFGILIFAFAAYLVCSPPRLSGAGMQTTKFTGIVQSIDPASKTIILKQVSTGVELKLNWFWDTMFLADDKRVKADVLKVGTQVEARYHSPLFGKEYATSIAWHSATKQSSRIIIPAEIFSGGWRVLPCLQRQPNTPRSA